MARIDPVVPWLTIGLKLIFDDVIESFDHVSIVKEVVGIEFVSAVVQIVMIKTRPTCEHEIILTARPSKPASCYLIQTQWERRQGGRGGRRCLLDYQDTQCTD